MDMRAAVVGCAAVVFGCAGAAAGALAPIAPEFRLFRPLGMPGGESLDLLASDVPVGVGETVRFGGVNGGFDFDMSFDVVTVGLERTVTVTYQSLGPTLVSPAAVAALPDVEGATSFGVQSLLGFVDGEVDPFGPANLDAFFLRDGTVVRTDSDISFRPQILAGPSGLSLVATTDVSPAAAGAFGVDGFVDGLSFVTTYTLVPAPGAGVCLALGGLLAARRRR